MNRFYRLGLAILAASLLLLSACQLGRDKTPSIIVDSMYTQAGLALRVSGRNWQPGSRVAIGFNIPGGQPQDSETLATTLTDASGSFVALFPFPADKPWARMTEIWIVAHTKDFNQATVASFHNPQIFTPTPLPITTVPATSIATPVVFVLGYVEKISAVDHSIALKPIEGQAKIITWVESTQVAYGGQLAQPTDIQVGDLIEASGQVTRKDTIIAAHISILVRVSTELTPTPKPIPPAVMWQGEYYDNTTFSGAPALTRGDAVINFQWQNGAAANGLPADNFAIRWTGTWPFEAGTYRFYAQVDDGVRLWLDAHLMIDQWHESTGALYSADAYLSVGSHTVQVEYFDAWANAHVRVWWEYRGSDVGITCSDWKAEYYNSMSLSGVPFLALNERTIDFNWGAGAPVTGMPADHFSARWTRTVLLDAGTYRFYALSDDGVQLWVDETMLIDHWMDSAAQTYVGDLYLPQGSHTIRVHYYENAGLAVIKVWWEALPATPTPTYTAIPPTSTPLPPTPTPIHLSPDTTPTYTPAIPQ